MHKKKIIKVFLLLTIALTGCGSSNAQNIAIGKKVHIFGSAQLRCNKW